MDEIFSVVVFLVFIVGAIAQKIAQARSMKDELPDEDNTPSHIPTARPAQGRSIEDAIPEAKARPQPHRPHGRELGPPPKTPGQELFESLFGPQTGQADEGDWKPVHQPAQRKELPRGLQPEAQSRPERVPTRPTPVQPKAQPQPQRPPQIPTPAAKRPTQPQPQRRPQPPQIQPTKRPVTPPPATLVAESDVSGPVEWPFSDLEDIRRGIIMAEILGPPKAFK